MILKNKYILTFLLVALQQISYGQIVLPFELYEDKYILITIPGLNSGDKLTFYFDTGASTTLLDKTVAERLNLKADFQQSVSGSSGNKMYDIVTARTLFLTPQLSIDNVNIVLEDLTRLNASIGNKFDGIIGNDILKHYLTKIDFTKKQILLYPFGEKLNTSTYTIIDFTFNNGIPIPQFPITIQLLNGDKFSGNVLFDSGAGLSLLLNTPFQQKNGVMDKVGNIITSSQNNLSNKTTTTLAVIKSLTIGTYTFDGKVPICISTDKDGVSSYEDYLGILGNDIINRFNIILDYSSKRLYLKPNDLYHKEFITAVSPVKLALIDGKIVISDVIEGTMAYHCGLREGQTVISINGLANQSIQAYRKMLLDENNEVEIKYTDHQDAVQTCHFKIDKSF